MIQQPERKKMSAKYLRASLLLLFVSSCVAPNQLPVDRALRHQIAGDQAFTQKDYVEAEKQYKAAIAEAEKAGPENGMVIIALHYLAQVYSAQQRDDEAEAILKRRLAMAEKIWVQEPKLLAAAYDDLAIFYLTKNRPADAKPYYERALTVEAEAFGADSLEVARLLELYAGLLRLKNEDAEAIQMETRANAIRSKLEESNGM